MPFATPRFDLINPADKEKRRLELTITYRGRVQPWQCDHLGHMNVMWYVGKFDEASWQLILTLGLTPSRFSKEGIGMVAVEQQIVYKRKLHAGDLVTIRSAVLELKEKSMRLSHEMSNDKTGELAATSNIVGAYIDANLGRACALPPDARERAALRPPRTTGEFMAELAGLQ
jgi:acyl-CoA thioester hydrolase